MLHLWVPTSLLSPIGPHVASMHPSPAGPTTAAGPTAAGPQTPCTPPGTPRPSAAPVEQPHALRVSRDARQRPPLRPPQRVRQLLARPAALRARQHRTRRGQVATLSLDQGPYHNLHVLTLQFTLWSRKSQGAGGGVQGRVGAAGAVARCPQPIPCRASGNRACHAAVKTLSTRAPGAGPQGSSWRLACSAQQPLPANPAPRAAAPGRWPRPAP